MLFKVGYDLQTDAKCVTFQLMFRGSGDGLVRTFPEGALDLGSVHPDKPNDVAQVRRLIEAEYKDGKWNAAIPRLQKVLDDKEEAFLAFFAHFPWRLPALPIRVHLTDYGPGGSYYPGAWTGANLSVLADATDPVEEVFVRHTLHETIHLVIEHPLIMTMGLNAPARHSEKEGIVSRIQESDQAKEIASAPRWPEGYALRPAAWQRNWIQGIPWRTPLTWIDC